MMVPKFAAFLLSLAILISIVCAGDEKTKTGGGKKDQMQEPKKKKDIRDYNDADMERLFDEWEEKDDPLEPDELPEWKRPPPEVDFSKIDPNNPEQLLQASKKGKTLMLFVSLTGDPSQEELEKVTSLWQTSLFNAHIDAQRFLIDQNRAIFMFKDGAMAWQAKDFLLQQDRCKEVTIEGKTYPGGKGDEKKKKSEL